VFIGLCGVYIGLLNTKNKRKRDLYINAKETYILTQKRPIYTPHRLCGVYIGLLNTKNKHKTDLYINAKETYILTQKRPIYTPHRLCGYIGLFCVYAARVHVHSFFWGCKSLCSSHCGRMGGGKSHAAGCTHRLQGCFKCM